jgi:cyanophycinase
MTRKYSLTLFVFLLAVSSLVVAQNKGNLFIIGGGERSSDMMKNFIQLAGGYNSNLLIIPNAGDDPLESALDKVKEFQTLGCKSIKYVVFDKNNIDADSTLSFIKKAKGIFFTGGDQVRLTKLFLGTKAFKEIKDVYKEGGVVGGTSAGAAIMSKIMITGEEKINKDTSSIFYTIQKGNVETIEGFGFIDDAVVDQHFIIRKRLNRLISVLLENPTKLGIGIDESTAIIVKPNKTFDVIGDRTVMVFDPSHVKNIKTNPEGLFSATDMKFHILQAGQSFDLKTKKVIK